jgi:hypothetical protein
MQKIATRGNATMIVYDDAPLLATDPWIGDEERAYFCSWVLSHRIPQNLKDDIAACSHIWFSHGHPEHLNPTGIERFKGKKILLADHVGGRIYKDISPNGFDVTILPDRQWVPLSEDNVEIHCITTKIQDSILLIDVCGKLFIDLNDAGTRDCLRYIRSITRTDAASRRHRCGPARTQGRHGHRGLRRAQGIGTSRDPAWAIGDETMAGKQGKVGMEDNEIRAALDLHWAASDANDFEVEHQIYREDAVLEYPQSGERIRGRRSIQASRRAQPNQKRFAVRRILGAADLWVTEFVLTYDGQPSFTVSIMEFKEGKVARETQYFGDPFEPGPSRAEWVERMQ